MRSSSSFLLLKAPPSHPFFWWVPPCPFLPPPFLSSTKMLGILPVLSATHPFCFTSTASLPPSLPYCFQALQRTVAFQVSLPDQQLPSTQELVRNAFSWAHPHPAEAEPSRWAQSLCFYCSFPVIPRLPAVGEPRKWAPEFASLRFP